jgi:hypothetical protein
MEWKFRFTYEHGFGDGWQHEIRRGVTHGSHQERIGQPSIPGGRQGSGSTGRERPGLPRYASGRLGGDQDEEIEFPLEVIELKKKDANYQLISDYTYWSDNWRTV